MCVCVCVCVCIDFERETNVYFFHFSRLIIKYIQNTDQHNQYGKAMKLSSTSSSSSVSDASVLYFSSLDN